jgi:outer membrane PBP1 activator LpoA protein
MSYFKKQLELLEYIKKPLSIESIDLLYKANNVRYENTLVYSDFSLSLIHLVINTYLGDELTSDEDKKKHFDWCWTKVNINFQKEQINLKTTAELKNYYYDFLEIAFYQNTEKEEDEKLTAGIIKYWKEIFDMQSIKTRAEVDVFLEVYKLFNSQLFEKK